MRVIIEAREHGGSQRIELDVRSDNWLDDERNNADRRHGIIEAANGLLRSLNLSEIEESQ